MTSDMPDRTPLPEGTPPADPAAGPAEQPADQAPDSADSSTEPQAAGAPPDQPGDIPPPLAESDTDAPVAPAGQRSFGRFWDLYLVIVFGAGLYGAGGGQPLIFVSAPGFLMLFLIAAFAIVHRWFWGHARRHGNWPPDYRDVLLAVVVQLALLMPLLQLSSWFSGPLLAVMGQVAAAVPPRRWWLPLGAPTLILAHQIGLFNAIAGNDWTRALTLATTVGWAIAIFLYMHLLLDERRAREQLRDDIAALRDEMATSRATAAELLELRHHHQQALILHDSIGHALAVIAIRLETIAGTIGEPAHSIEINELRDLVRRTLAELRNLPAAPAPPGPQNQAVGTDASPAEPE
ncbi:MAG TPA: histidine kinase dimerization/phosphoacceptor domain-containing protein, partial [Roseiflexaceae bacterium]|nr:histidine kinase dimerization/phosphoacceptor domain-containing protein [Roseiflexaceae bacterium]